MQRRRLLQYLAAGAALPALQARAQDAYPASSVTVLVTVPPGGNPDVLARLVTERMGHQLGKPFIIDNRAGAAGNVATGMVAKARPDGYTLGLLTSAEVAINPHLYTHLPYKPERDLLPVVPLAIAPTVLTVDARLPVKTLAEFIAYAKARPGQLNFGSSGIGSIHHFTAEAFSRAVGIKMTHIPFKGSAATVPALVAGDIQASFVGIPLVRELAAQGKVRMLGVSTLKRVHALPDLPTLAEQGVPNFNVVTTMGLYAPAGTPEAVCQRLYGAARQALADPEVAAKLTGLGMELMTATQAQYAQLMAQESAGYSETVRALALKVE